ncbi:MAG: helix-turn-helix domain-containing protein, partial [Proteobacteria bacterium]|nr:helix-turn-helix domain-containing protein [Pseudomonadota bacterium]
MTSVKTIRALERGLQVVRLLEEHGRMTLQDLHFFSGLPKATLLRVLATLEDQGWTKRTLGDRSYRLSFDAVSMGSKILPDTELMELAAPILDQLCQRVFWPSDIAVFTGTTMQIMETSRRQAPFLINRKVMGIKPHVLYSALGRVYLANCTEAERQEIVTRLQNSNLREDRTAKNEKWLQRLL